MLFMQTAMDWIDELPVTETAINRAINEARDSTYRVAVEGHEWEKLATIHQTKNIFNDDAHRSLLFRRCVLEYRGINEKGQITRWYDIHPLIEGIEEFQKAVHKLNQST
ncbi:MAG: hypothetical protein AB4426_17240 [Xenococcaceae cyanobacterium]